MFFCYVVACLFFDFFSVFGFSFWFVCSVVSGFFKVGAAKFGLDFGKCEEVFFVNFISRFEAGDGSSASFSRCPKIG